ncbi:Hsp70 family protein [Arthrobacter crusticola]|uniref:Hsp70 family protein n=1 Tax=Arthrobacter crusticola TaxID=2547960 RepID=A0A4R5TZV0_9MICC|nr:Hsp70 family protein [Arthrobacter crusticola]TDK26824.1 Hsp70 family protein [Arthrobacter crusticola]
MPYVLGVDIGTSFTAAAITRLGGDSVAAPSSLGLGLRGGAVPTVVFLDEDGRLLVGEAAERRGLECPERMVREFKRRIGDPVPFVIGGVSVAAEDLFATMARWVVDRAGEREGEPPVAVTLSHPAGWGDHRTGLVRGALAGVGLADAVLLSEPEAAALHYASQERVEPGSTIAVYDLGGGTFDAAVLRKNDTDTFTVLGRPGGIERLGGADFDQAVFAHVCAGAGPAFADLDASDPGVLSALARLRRECTEAKEALSADSEATIPVLLPEAHTSVRLVRSEFEAMIEDPVRSTVEVLAGVLEAAGVGAGDLDAILLIGGSSRIPLVAELLSEELERPIAIDADPKASISLGAAFAAAGLVEEDLDGDGGGVPVGVPGSPERPERPAMPSGAPPVLDPAGAASARSRTGVRIGAVAVSVALLTGLTATAAQSPRFFGGLSAAAEADSSTPTPGSPTGEPKAGDSNPDAPDRNWFSQLTDPVEPPATASKVPAGIAALGPGGESGSGTTQGEDSGAGDDDSLPAEGKDSPGTTSADPGTAGAEGSGEPSTGRPAPGSPDPTPGAPSSSPSPSPVPEPIPPVTEPTPPPVTPPPVTEPPVTEPTPPPVTEPPVTEPPPPPATQPPPTTEPALPPATEPPPTAEPTPPAGPVPTQAAPVDPGPVPDVAVETAPAPPPAAPEG